MKLATFFRFKLATLLGEPPNRSANTKTPSPSSNSFNFSTKFLFKSSILSFLFSLILAVLSAGPAISSQLL